MYVQEKTGQDEYGEPRTSQQGGISVADTVGSSTAVQAAEQAEVAQMAEVTVQSLQSQGASPTSAAVSHVPQIPSKASSVSAQAAQSDADYTQVGSQLLSLSSESLSALPSPMHPAAVPPAVAQDVNDALARSLLQGPHASGLTEAHSARLTSAYSGKFQRSSLHTNTAWSTAQPSNLVKSGCLQHECVLHATVQPRRQAESSASSQECTDVPTYTHQIGISNLRLLWLDASSVFGL